MVVTCLNCGARFVSLLDLAYYICLACEDAKQDSNIGRIVYCCGCNRDESILLMHREGWRIVAGNPTCPHCDDVPDEWIELRRQYFERQEETWPDDLMGALGWIARAK